MIEEFFQAVLDQHCYGSLLKDSRSVGGGCINNTARLTTNDGTYFLKWNQAIENELFETEAKGLKSLEESSPLRLPQVLGQGKQKDKAYLLLEWIESGYAESTSWKSFGEGLAQLHRTSAPQFGLDYDNFIGRLPQQNRPHIQWADFFRQERLEPQLQLASSKKLIDSSLRSSFDRLFPILHQLVPAEVPALLHGDLWSGNFMMDQDASPVLVDPAIYFGHRETELAFTHLFGGFDNQFYAAYHSNYPLEQGFEERIEIHNLYPLLVHVNLFGSAYLSGIKQTLKRFT